MVGFVYWIYLSDGVQKRERDLEIYIEQIGGGALYRHK